MSANIDEQDDKQYQIFAVCNLKQDQSFPEDRIQYDDESEDYNYWDIEVKPNETIELDLILYCCNQGHKVPEGILQPTNTYDINIKGGCGTQKEFWESQKNDAQDVWKDITFIGESRTKIDKINIACPEAYYYAINNVLGNLVDDNK